MFHETRRENDALKPLYKAKNPSFFAVSKAHDKAPLYLPFGLFINLKIIQNHEVRLISGCLYFIPNQNLRDYY